MTTKSANNLDELEGLQLTNVSVQGFDVPEYTLLAKRGAIAPYWAYKRKRKLKPEAVVKLFLEDHGYSVMDGEGVLIRNIHQLMCLIAYDEEENGPMITESEYCKTIVMRPCFIVAPSAPFTRTYIQNLLTNISVNELIEYLKTFGSLCYWKRPPWFLDDELETIAEFLTVFGLDRFLRMSELALTADSGMIGWPDITALKDNCVHFIEVKTTDSLTKMQKNWLTIYKDSLNLDYRIIRIRPYEQ